MGDQMTAMISQIWSRLEEIKRGRRSLSWELLREVSSQAMPPLHKYFGNPLLTAIGRLFSQQR